MCFSRSDFHINVVASIELRINYLDIGIRGVDIPLNKNNRKKPISAFSLFFLLLILFFAVCCYFHFCNSLFVLSLFLILWKDAFALFVPFTAKKITLSFKKKKKEINITTIRLLRRFSLFYFLKKYRGFVFFAKLGPSCPKQNKTKEGFSLDIAI